MFFLPALLIVPLLFLAIGTGLITYDHRFLSFLSSVFPKINYHRVKLIRTIGTLLFLTGTALMMLIHYKANAR